MEKLPKHVLNLFEVFRKNGYQLYLVGGAVRNLILNKQVDNWDFATNATPEIIQKLFPDSFYNNVYGTVSIPTDSGIMEITPYRKEGEYTDARHPSKIEWAKSIDEDLSRRDFTVNAIAFDGKTIIDPFHGRDHLIQKIIAAVGDPDKRFGEDALRLIRAIRFASQLGFLIEEETRISLQKNAALIQKVSWERIRDEFLKIMESDHPSEGVLFLHNAGILRYILPEVEVCFTIPQKSPKRHHVYDVGTHLVMALKHCPSKDPITRFAVLLHDVGKAPTFRKDETGLITFYNHEVAGYEITKNIAERFRLSNKQKEKLVRLVQYHQFTVSEVITDKAVRRFIREVGREYLQDMFDVRTGDRVGSGAAATSWRYELFKKRVVEVQKEPFKVTDLKVNGHDVMTLLNLTPGRKIGDILDVLFEKVITGKLKNVREELLQEIKIHGINDGISPQE